MIYDNLSNIDRYKGLSEDIYQGLAFLKQATSNLQNGTHQITPRVKAIVSEYETVSVNECGYEAHKRFIDIQCLLKGEEKVGYSPIEMLKETKPYSKEIDAVFIRPTIRPHTSVFSLTISQSFSRKMVTCRNFVPTNLRW